MKKNYFLIALICVFAISLTSCMKRMVPTAQNSLSSVSFAELGLNRNEYEIMKTETASATIMCTFTKKRMAISDMDDGQFKLVYKKAKSKGGMFKHISGSNTPFCYELVSHKGILRIGHLFDKNIEKLSDSYYTGEYIARATAMYRLANQAKELGADCIIEPLVSTNFEDRGKTIVYKVSVSGKPVKIKSDN